MAITFQDKMTIKILADGILYEIAGWENELEDGDITEEAFKDLVSEKHLTTTAQQLLDEAYVSGYLKSNIQT